MPFATWCNVKMQNAIGTSSAIGFPIARAGRLATSEWLGRLAVGSLGRVRMCRSGRAGTADRCRPSTTRSPVSGVRRHPAWPGDDDVGLFSAP